MKKKLLTKLTGILLSAAMVFSTIPVNAGTTVTSDASAESAVTSETQTVADIFTFDWKNATVDEINEAVYNCDNADLGAWLLSMSEDELEELLKLDTYLHNKTEVADYVSDDEGNLIVEDESSVKTMEYYEYAISMVPKNNQLTFNNKSGYYYYKFWIGGLTYTYKMSISGVETGKNATTQQTVSLALTIPSGVPAWLDFNSPAGTSTTSKKLQQDKWGSTSNYNILYNGINFTKPAGYKCVYSASPLVSSTGMYFYDTASGETTHNSFTGYDYSQEGVRLNLSAAVNLRDAGINATQADGSALASQHTTFHFGLDPITYYVGYSGNGSTGGGMGDQACTYDVVYTPAANGYVRDYLITYNANGGTASKVNEVVSYTFAGWGLNNASTVTHSTATPFANLTTTEGSGGAFYAIWQPKSTALATASRTGYSFNGWKSNIDGREYAPGHTFTPVASTVMTGNWTANKYTVKFNSNGGTACSNISATYDSAFNLPTPTRSGYKFTGWSGAGRTFAGTDLKSVKNLSATNNDVVSLTANWEVRNDIPYKVIHMVQETPDSENYIEKEVETLYGTTGNSVTPAAKNYEGYIFNEEESDRTKQISGDGTTNFIYKYKLDVPEVVPYTVEHYLQDPVTKEYVLDEDNSFTDYADEESSITPDVIMEYVGYDIPNPQTVVVTADGKTVVRYYYKLSSNIPYKVVHMLQTVEGSDEYEEYEVESMNGTHGDSVTPAVKTYDGYVSPQVQTVTIAGDGSTVVEYLYDIRVKDMASYRVEHYLQDKSTGEYVLDENTVEEHEVADGTSVTPDVITTYTGYVVPTPQTIMVKADSENVVKYYYSLAGADSVYIENNDNSSKGDANNFKAGDVKYYTDKDGNTYKILVNSDGTLTVQSIKTAGKSKSNLTVSSSITINGVKYTVTEIAPYAFKNNKTIKSVKIGNGIKKIGKGAFKNCVKLKKVTYGTSLEVIDSQAFYGCKNLTTVKTNKALTKIGSKAFYNCKKLKSYTVGKYVKVIGTSAFQNCKKLKKITIAESVEIIEKKAFYGCSKLKNVHVKTTKLIKIGKQAFKKCDKKIGFVIPEKKKKAYVKLLKNKY